MPISAGRRRVGRPRKAGRPKGSTKRKTAKGLWDTIKKKFSAAKDWLKENKFISKNLRTFGSSLPYIGSFSSPLADLAEKHGYGKRRRRRAGRRRR